MGTSPHKVKIALKNVLENLGVEFTKEGRQVGKASTSSNS